MIRSRRFWLALGGVALGLLLLRRCVPGLWGPQLPAQVVRRISDDHRVCIGVDEVPIWPGDYRQAQCGTVTIDVLARGVVPAEEQTLGTDAALCYRMTVENPYWEVARQTRHEILTQSRVSYKVALVQNGVWTIFPDEDIQDRARWERYACPAVPD
ncbi:MAG TPA: hypothetical protein VFI11_01445 [Anaerolineales bacterium]|nr:hypothetical protein [Anaerolineales bacterium]